MADSQAEAETRLVIAIDYGTTFTGIAWATPNTNRADLSEIEVVRVWGDRMDNHEKVPSVISYSTKTDKNEQQWGSDLSKHAIAMVHTKLQLDVDNTSNELDLILQQLEGMHNLNFKYVQDTEGESRYTIKGPEKIVEDYLKLVFEFLMRTVEKFSKEFLRLTPVDIVATVPAEWSYRAKNSTFRALTRAGFNRRAFPELRDFLLVTEPEAAAVYTARQQKELMGADFLNPGESFVLCDAGGGTVDVASYKVKQLDPYFEIEPAGVPIGSKCGAIFINVAFKHWLRDLIGEEKYQQLDQVKISYKISSHDAEGERMRILMKRFEIRKKRFVNDGRDIRIELPEPFHNLNIPDRVDKGLILIPYKTMESFFLPCVKKIRNLILNQAEDIENEGTRLKNVFLVGGFAESPYLQASIRRSLELLHGDVQLRIPATSDLSATSDLRQNHSWTAVVRGAALFGIEKSNNRGVSTMSACPRSYGVSVNAPFSVIAHHPGDRATDPLTTIDMAEGQLKWLITKGELILSDKAKEVTAVFKKNFTATGPKTGSFPIYAYDFDDPPDRLKPARNEVRKLHDLEYDLGDRPLTDYEPRFVEGRSRPFYVASLSLKMRVAPGYLQVQLWLKDSVAVSISLVEPLLSGLHTLDLP